jgi:peptidoglycan/LPS O-acetylase OafA/YrhL
MRLRRLGHFSVRTSSSDYPYFDWLRFILASAVVLVHAGIITWFFAGVLAVQSFFALSGWLIGGILLRTKAAALPRFYFNRAARIWIPYFVAVLLLYGLSFLREPITWRWSEFLFYDVTFTRYWFGVLPTEALAFPFMPFHGVGGHFWSISVEEQFYLFAPLLLVLLTPFGRSPILWGVLSVLLAAFGSGFASVSFGVFAACLQQVHKDWHLQTVARIALVVIAVATVIVLYRYEVFRTAPIFALSVVLLLATPGERNDVGVFFGGISYPLYLNHWLGAFIAHSAAKRIWFLGPYESALDYLFAVVVAAILYVVIDLQVHKHRSSFYTAVIGRRVTAVAYSLLAIGLIFGLVRWTWFAS